MGFFDKVNSIANRVLPASDDGRRSSAPRPSSRDQRIQYDDYGQQGGYERIYDDYAGQQAYDDAPADGDAYGNYETSEGERYILAGARPQAQQGRRGGAGGFLGNLFDRMTGAGSRQPAPPPPPQQDPWGDTSTPDNVVSINSRDGQDAPYPDERREEPQRQQRPRYEPQPRRETRPVYDEPPEQDDGGYGEDDLQASYYGEEPPRERQPQRRANPFRTALCTARRLDDASEIIDNMIKGNSIFVNMENVDDVVRQRLLDMLSGAAFALDCVVKRLSYGSYIVAPSGIEIVNIIGASDRDRDIMDDGGMRGGFRGRGESRVQQYDRERERERQSRDWDRDRERY